MNALTARMTLEALELPPGAAVTVTGAAETVGGYAVQRAKAAGLTVIADAADKDRDLVAGLGADHVLPRGDGFAARVRETASWWCGRCHRRRGDERSGRRSGT
ncbi:hypothetical protein [Streptomyces caniscabiei]|uniref:hypothetical protein n=1 Tax=Streptomyces caniscabiei TaxID=2746961 RepID=UPI000765CB0C|nr:hypothetical protein [Streptomyces caniscabiei]